jgi:hypothetical protein
MKINEHQLKAVLALSGPQRYAHFIKVAADQRKVWGLFSEGWALAETNNGDKVFVLWPAQEYAKLCAVGEWLNYKIREIDLDTLFEVLIPKLKEANTLVGVFPTANERGITPDLSQFEADLRNELAKIE